MTVINGTCSPKFVNVREQLERNVADGLDAGASVAVTVEGELVVDLWGGSGDEWNSTSWEESTITPVFSLSRTMMTIVVLLLHDGGHLALDDRVSKFWPAFSQSGKDDVKLCHVLSHASGLPTWSDSMSTSDLFDWDIATSRLARQAPFWPSGARIGYHALTQGFIIGEVIRRVTGQSLPKFYKENIADSLGIDFQFGLAPADEDRLCVPFSAYDTSYSSLFDPSDGDDQHVSRSTFENPPLDYPDVVWSEEWRRAEIGAVGGYGNARSVAKAHSLLVCNGELDGLRVLTGNTCRKILDVQAEGVDVVLRKPMRYGLGFGLASDTFRTAETSCWWGGLGGSVSLLDFESRSVITYIMNRMTPGLLQTGSDVRAASIISAANSALLN